MQNDTPQCFISFHQMIAFRKAKKDIFVISDSSSTEWCQKNAKKASTRFLRFPHLIYISGGPEKIGQILFFIFLYLISIVRSILFHEKMRLQILYNNIYMHLI